MSTSHNPMAVVVGVNGSASALQAVRWATRVALRDSVPVRLVHAYQLPLEYPSRALVRESMLDRVREEGRRWIARAREVATENEPHPPIEVVFRAGPASRLLLRESASASVVVLGTRGLSALTGLLVGCTTVAVAGQAHCPVVVVRGAGVDEAPNDSGPVVLGVDLNHVNDSAIDYAFSEAAAGGGELVAVHAWVESLLDAADVDQIEGVDLEEHRHRALEVLTECLSGWQEKYPGVRVRHEVVHDRPGRALRGFSHGAQLVVVARRPHDAFRSLVLGSTSMYLLHHALCPIAVIRNGP